MKNAVYDIIKKQNGEKFARAIRDYDSGIMDVPNLPFVVKYAGREANGSLLRWLESLKKVKIHRVPVCSDPIELLSQAGYDAYVADTLEKQNAIEKYFAPGEKLCTFKDPNRFKNYFIINAVRRDVDSVARSPHPSREDEYGTSVISIQVLKAGGYISIKNRYNHTVECPDNTFKSNLDNIIEGLSDAVSKYFNVDFSTALASVPNNYVVVGNQICKYNLEHRGVYYGSNFYIKDGRVCELNKNIEWMLHPGLVFNVSTKRIHRKYSDTELDWLEDFLEEHIKNKSVQIPKNIYGGYDIVAGGKKILSFQDGMITWVGRHKKEWFQSGISYSKFSGDVLDFSGFDDFYLEDVDVSNVKNLILNPNAKRIYLHQVTGLHGMLDFSNVHGLVICESDISRAVIKLNQCANIIDLSYVTGFAGNHDLSNVRFLDCVGTDCSGATIKLNPHGVIRGFNPSHPAYNEFLAARAPQVQPNKGWSR
jgi:hypothetical protein